MCKVCESECKVCAKYVQSLSSVCESCVQIVCKKYANMQVCEDFGKVVESVWKVRPKGV